MVGKPFSREKVKACLSGIWKDDNIKELKRSLYLLGKAGLLEKVEGDKWVITPFGEFTIFQTAKQSKKSNRGFRVDDFVSPPQKSRAKAR